MDMPEERVPRVDDEVQSTYDAFISYSHAAADIRIAQSVQAGLQRLAKPWYKRRALHVFRDTSGLSVNPDLWAAISDALGDSRFFILVASPASAASEWVGREVQEWLATRPAYRILIVVTEGDIEWVNAASDFDWDRSTALNPALRGAFDREPLYLDLRWAHDESDLSLRLPRYRSCVADLAAPIHGKPKEDLESDDLREQHKLRRVARAGVSILSVLLVLAIASTVIALGQRAQARHAADLAEARSLSAEAESQIPTGRGGLALLLAAAGDHFAAGAPTHAALLQALEAERGLYRDFATSSGTVGSAAFSSNGRLVAAADGGVIRIWDLASGHEVAHPNAPRSPYGIGPIAFGDRDRTVAAYQYGTQQNSLQVRDLQTGSLHSIPGGSVGNQWAISSAAPRLALVDDQGNVEIWDGLRGQLVRSIPTQILSAEEPAVGVALSADGGIVAVSTIEANPSAAGDYLDVINAWNADTGGTVGQPCAADVGGAYDGQYRMPPTTPQPLTTLVEPDGRTLTTLISGGTRAIVSHCSVASGMTSSSTINVPTTPTAPVSGFADDGKVIATRDTVTGAIRVFRSPSAIEIRPSVEEPSLSPYEAGVVAFSPDGGLMAAPDSGIGELKVWSTSGGDALTQPLRSPTGVSLVAVGPHADSLLVSTPSGDEEVSDATTGREKVRVTSAELGRDQCGFVTNLLQYVGSGDYIASPVQSSQNGNCGRPAVALWNVKSGARRQIDLPSRACSHTLTGVGLSPDDHTLVIGCADESGASGTSRDTVARIDVSSPNPRLISVNHVDLLPQSLTVGPGADVVIAAEEDHAGGAFQVLVDFDGELQREPPIEANGNFVGPAAFAPDGTQFATSFSDGRVELWHVSDHPQPVQLASPGPLAVTALAFSPDSSQLAVGDGTGGVRIWDTSSNQLLGTITQQPNSIDSLGYTTDGRSLVALTAGSYDPAGSKGSMVALTVDPAAWLHAACSIVHHNLTQAEWDEYVATGSYRPTCPS